MLNTSRRRAEPADAVTAPIDRYLITDPQVLGALIGFAAASAAHPEEPGRLFEQVAVTEEPDGSLTIVVPAPSGTRRLTAKAGTWSRREDAGDQAE
jgi:hypothetical protein